MSINHSRSWQYAFVAETLYADGKSDPSVKYDCTPFIATDKALFSSMPFPNGAQATPVPDYTRQFVQGASLGADTVLQWIESLKYHEFTIKQYVQDATWLTEAFATKTGGTVPNSFVFHIESAIDQFDICGCVLTKYVLEIPDSGFPTETLTFLYYKVVETDVVAITDFSTTTDCKFLVTAPKVKKDMSIEIDGDTIATLENATMTITIDVLDGLPAGKYYRQDPAVISRSFELDASFPLDAAAQAHLPSSALASLVTIKVDQGADICQVTECRCDESNEGEVPEFGIKTWDIKMRNGGTCLYTLPV